VKHLKYYKESVEVSIPSEYNVDTNIIKDILLDLDDAGLSTDISYSGAGKSWAAITIFLLPKDFFYWKDTKHAIGHLTNYMDNCGYQLSENIDNDFKYMDDDTIMMGKNKLTLTFGLKK
jgi:hypothetical protein